MYHFCIQNTLFTLDATLDYPFQISVSSTYSSSSSSVTLVVYPSLQDICFSRFLPSILFPHKSLLKEGDSSLASPSSFFHSNSVCSLVNLYLVYNGRLPLCAAKQTTTSQPPSNCPVRLVWFCLASNISCLLYMLLCFLFAHRDDDYSGKEKPIFEDFVHLNFP